MNKPDSSSPSKTRLLRNLIVAGTVVFGLAVVANFWSFRPTSTMQSFISHVLSGRFADASKLVSASGSIATGEDSYAFAAGDGTSSTVPIGKAEFQVLEDPNRPPRVGVVDYLLGRQQFAVCAKWDDDSGVSHLVPIYCTAHGATIEINHVGVVAPTTK